MGIKFKFNALAFSIRKFIIVYQSLDYTYNTQALKLVLLQVENCFHWICHNNSTMKSLRMQNFWKRKFQQQKMSWNIICKIKTKLSKERKRKSGKNLKNLSFTSSAIRTSLRIRQREILIGKKIITIGCRHNFKCSQTWSQSYQTFIFPVFAAKLECL